MLPLNPRKKLQRKKRIKIGICINGKKISILFSGRPVITNISTCLPGEEILPLIWHSHGNEYTKISHSILFQILYYGIHFQQKIRNKNSMGFKRRRKSCRCCQTPSTLKMWWFFSILFYISAYFSALRRHSFIKLVGNDSWDKGHSNASN